MTPKIMLDHLRTTWDERSSKELVTATNQDTEEEENAQRASGACDALTRALHRLEQLPDRESPSLGTFEELEQLIVGDHDDADTRRLNLLPDDQDSLLLEIMGEVEEYRLILQDIRSKQVALRSKDAEIRLAQITIPNHVSEQADNYTIDFCADEGRMKQPGWFPVFEAAKKSADQQREDLDGKALFTNARFVVCHDGLDVYLSEIARRKDE